MSKTNPLVSIIVPVFNNEKYVGECIRSILDQDYTNIELIVVDDGSTDNSSIIIKQSITADNRARLISRKNGGVSSARNAGLDAAKGDYLFFVDSDDQLDPSCISYYISLIQKHSADCAIVPMPLKFVDGDSITAPIDPGDDYVINGKDGAKMMLLYKIVISSWGKMFSKELINENKIRFDEELAYGEGFYFSILCLLNAKTVAIGHKKVYRYRLDNTSSAMTKYKKRLVDDSIKSQQIIRELLGDNIELLKASDYAFWHTCCDCYNTLVGAGANDAALKKKLSRLTRKNSLKNLNLPIPLKDKAKSILFFISPSFASRIINKGRKRKFSKSDD